MILKGEAELRTYSSERLRAEQARVRAAWAAGNFWENPSLESNPETYRYTTYLNTAHSVKSGNLSPKQLADYFFLLDRLISEREAGGTEGKKSHER